MCTHTPVCFCVCNKPRLPGWSLHVATQGARPSAFVFPTILPSAEPAIKHEMVPLWNSRLLQPKGFLTGYTGSILEPVFLPSAGFIFNLDLSWNLFSQPKAVAYTPCAREGCSAGRTQRRQRALGEDRKLPGCSNRDRSQSRYNKNLQQPVSWQGGAKLLSPRSIYGLRRLCIKIWKAIKDRNKEFSTASNKEFDTKKWLSRYSSCCLVTKSCPTLWPHGLKPARLLCPWASLTRVLEWVAIFFSRRSSPPKDQTRVSCIAGNYFLFVLFFNHWTTWEAPSIYNRARL